LILQIEIQHIDLSWFIIHNINISYIYNFHDIIAIIDIFSKRKLQFWTSP